MPRFSIITCISKPDIYEKCLLSSINKCRKNHDIEIIPIINNDNRYSASVALNIGLEASKSQFSIVAHQDVSLQDDWFDQLEKHIHDLDEWGVLGSAGISLEFGRSDIGAWGGALDRDTVAVGTVWDSDESEEPYWDGAKEPTKVHCIDECLFVVNNQLGLRFDPAFTGFHFYGIDLCLQSRAAVYPVYAAHLPIIHYGRYSASLIRDHKYWYYLRFLFSKWRYQFPELLSTHMHWSMRAEDGLADTIVNVPEIISYIPMKLETEGLSIDILSMGIGEVNFAQDKRRGFID